MDTIRIEGKPGPSKRRRMPLRAVGVLFFAALSGLILLAACGGDDEEATGTPAATLSSGQTQTPSGTSAAEETQTPAATAEPAGGAEDGGSAPSGSGSATLTIGAETWTFDDVFCAFSPQESRNDRVSFTLSSFGSSSTGARIQLDATIQDTDEQGRYEGDGTIHSVSLNDVDDFENPSVAWSADSGIVAAGLNIEVDGKSVRAEGAFDDQRTDLELEEVPGTLEATCP